MFSKKEQTTAVLAAMDRVQSIIEYDLDGKILSANENFLALYGYARDEIIGQPLRKLSRPEYENNSKTSEFWEKLRQGDPVFDEFQRYGKDGSEIWVQASCVPLLDKKGKAFKIVEHAADITAHKLLNTDLKGQIDALNRSQAVIEFDLDGIILFANENFLKTMGYNLEEIKGMHHSLFVEDGYAKSDEYKNFWKQLKGGEFLAGEYMRLGKDGKEVWIQASYNPILDASGKPVKVVKFATDVTERKLQNSDYHGQIEAIGKSQAVIHFDMQGNILEANENFLAAMGYHLDEIKGRHHSMFVEEDYAKSAEYQAFWEKLNRGEYLAGDYERFGKDGKSVWIQASYNPILDMNGHPFKVVKYANDVTARKLRNADVRGQIAAIGKSQAVIHFDMNGNILDANENFLAAMGYSLDEIKGRHHSMFVKESYGKSTEYQAFWEQLNRGEFLADEFERIGKDGKSVWIQASYNPILDMNGHPFKVVKYATDISDQMAARKRAGVLSSDTDEKVQSVAGATQEMQASIQEISQNMNRSQQAVTDIVTKTDHAKGLTVRLQDTSKSMENVVEIIREIAGRVNLLALNATIEAARAGEAGKGFAVVAGEVKNLATQTAKATDDIYQEIQAMQAVADDVVNSTEVIAASTGSVNEFVSAITAAIEEQSAVTNDISRNMEHFATGITELNDCVQRLSGKG